MFDLNYYNELIEMTRFLDKQVEEGRNKGTFNTEEAKMLRKKSRAEQVEYATAKYSNRLATICMYEASSHHAYYKWYKTYFETNQRYYKKAGNRSNISVLLEQQNKIIQVVR